VSDNDRSHFTGKLQRTRGGKYRGFEGRREGTRRESWGKGRITPQILEHGYAYGWSDARVA